MNIEHFAINVSDPVALADWYVQHLGLVVVRQVDEGPMTRFLADGARRVVVEVYKQNAPVPDYRAMNPFTFHIAFVAEDVARTRARLIAAGAKAEGEITTAANGDVLCFVRDPWGVTLQLAKRGQALVE
jgi:catechol 2,3-dioxygenase-like lactoylglutathione lyase family enzyme